jgi:magnesium and cobalt transporter
MFMGAPKDKQDLMEALNDAQESQLLDEEAVHMIEGVMDVAEMRVQDIMIPRAQMEFIKIDESLESITNICLESGHSRFPVVDEDKDDIVGILLVKDLLPYINDSTRDFKLRDILRRARFIPESKRLNVLLKDFRKTRQHMAIVIDEYGGVAGLITIEDVIEEIIGEIDDEHDEIDSPEIREISSTTETTDNNKNIIIKKYWLDALYSIDDLNEKFELDISDEKADTIGGLVASTFGKMPNKGEEITIGPCHFIILKTTKRRIESLEMQLRIPE